MKNVVILFDFLLEFCFSNSQSTSPGQTVIINISKIPLIKVSGTPITFQFTGTPDTGVRDKFADAISIGTSLQYTSILCGGISMEVFTTATQRNIYITSTAHNVAQKGFNIAVTGMAPSGTGYLI